MHFVNKPDFSGSSRIKSHSECVAMLTVEGNLLTKNPMNLVSNCLKHTLIASD